MNDLSAHFFITVGQLLDHAAVGRLRVRLELADGRAANGVPFLDHGGSGARLDDTGYPRHIRVGEQVVALDQVRGATVVHPDAEPTDPAQ